ncbi:hypothetical protein H6G33_31065 [Calothrix sp. FACHB-1219]|uniref:hypothetical protein n=1 Tax=unclassified Calothrix TaxID=2619626 RepID=UPI0016823C45|nr:MULTISPECIES: hypothetical protein [unclassified Calothrix]MBD2208034.1 hypothetical protein [Calothrix sp. FACHB-168]MBD2221415.1 hypothetical protein [Calothrix sp. FACHB-1219]
MARRGSELTVPTEETSVQTSSQAITRSKKTDITTHNQQASAQAIEELEIAFDFDLRMAIIQRLVQDKQVILQLKDKERQIAEALELARLEAIEIAHEEGKQQARAKIVQKKAQQKAVTQQHFIDVELPQLIDSCDYLPYETMKQTINEFASRIGVKLQWRDLSDGQFECIPSIG